MIPVLKRFLLLLSPSFFFSCASAPDFYTAENLSAKPFNQLDLAGNACGPAALLNSYRFGSTRWRKLAQGPPESSDRDKIRAIARGPAMRESSSLPGRARWSRNGINLSDLKDVANEIAYAQNLPPVRQETLFLKPGETQKSHLARVHSLLTRSLANGFPPIISIRRFVLRNNSWTAVQGHYVTVTSVQGRIPRGQDHFSVSYIDPWGGKKYEGIIKTYPEAFLADLPDKNANLEAAFPATTAGKRFVRKGEKNLLAMSGFLGRP
ncbi:MAG: hypothetical protein AB8D78_00135 [Akkermansiaceae bacterium]